LIALKDNEQKVMEPNTSLEDDACVKREYVLVWDTIHATYKGGYVYQASERSMECIISIMAVYG
jgi:hypothetical protein